MASSKEDQVNSDPCSPSHNRFGEGPTDDSPTTSDSGESSPRTNSLRSPDPGFTESWDDSSLTLTVQKSVQNVGSQSETERSTPRKRMNGPWPVSPAFVETCRDLGLSPTYAAAPTKSMSRRENEDSGFYRATSVANTISSALSESLKESRNTPPSGETAENVVSYNVHKDVQSSGITPEPQTPREPFNGPSRNIHLTPTDERNSGSAVACRSDDHLGPPQQTWQPSTPRRVSAEPLNDIGLTPARGPRSIDSSGGVTHQVRARPPIEPQTPSSHGLTQLSRTLERASAMKRTSSTTIPNGQSGVLDTGIGYRHKRSQTPGPNVVSPHLQATDSGTAGSFWRTDDSLTVLYLALPVVIYLLVLSGSASMMAKLLFSLSVSLLPRRMIGRLPWWPMQLPVVQDSCLVMQCLLVFLILDAWVR